MSNRTVLFLCPHGGAKSVAAAAYFTRLAEEAGLDYTGIAAASESPYPSVPQPMAGLLAREGFDVRTFQPRQVEERDVRDAAKVISIGCDLSSGVFPSGGIEQWDDVPQASEDLEGSAAAIRRHVEALAKALTQELRDGR